MARILLRRLAVSRVRLALARRAFANSAAVSSAEAQHHLVELFVELLGVIENRQVMSFLGGGWRDVQMALAFEDRAGHLAVNFVIEGNVAVAEGEGGRIAAQHQVTDRNHITTRRQAA